MPQSSPLVADPHYSQPPTCLWPLCHRPRSLLTIRHVIRILKLSKTMPTSKSVHPAKSFGATVSCQSVQAVRLSAFGCQAGLLTRGTGVWREGDERLNGIIFEAIGGGGNPELVLKHSTTVCKQIIRHALRDGESYRAFR